MAQVRPLVPELAEVARTQLNEDDSLTATAIEEFRARLLRHPDLVTRTDDQFLIGFLRFCQYDQEAAQKRLEYYYNYKSTAGDLLKCRQIDDKLFAICRAGIFVTLPRPAGPGGPRIHFTRMGKIDTSLFNVRDLFRYHVFRSEMEINSDDNWIISGVIEIIDFSKIPFAFLRQFEVNLFKKMSAFLEYGMPTNLIATHIVNASMEAQIILHLVRTVMKQKELLHIHSNVESLQQAVGKEYLPVELGGSNGTLDESIDRFEQQLEQFKGYFSEDAKYGVGSVFKPDMEGGASFRKLDID